MAVTASVQGGVVALLAEGVCFHVRNECEQQAGAKRARPRRRTRDMRDVAVVQGDVPGLNIESNALGASLSSVSMEGEE